ncbi:MAG: hypothetical protein K2X47_00570 [Bdellovibrionales bacterium]|nr:hypothetical protein [Bdellovibrionales bacterium]
MINYLPLMMSAFLLSPLLAVAGNTNLSQDGTGSICGALSGIEPKNLANIRDRLDRGFLQKKNALDELKMDPDQIEPVLKLGDGYSGHVFKVKVGGMPFALKIFTDPYLRTGNPTETDLHEVDDGILIQKALGEAGVAPVVKGIVEEGKLNPWISRHPVVSQSIRAGKLGLLMELTNSRSIKEHGQFLKRLPIGTQKQLVSDAVQIDKVLEYLGIAASDVDAVLTDEGRLKLIDTSSFFRAPDGGGVRGFLLQFIN